MKKKTVLSTALMLSALSTSVFAATPESVVEVAIDNTSTIASTGVVKDTAITTMDAVEKVKPTIGITVEERFFASKLDGGIKSDNIDYNGGTIDWKDTVGLPNENSPETILRYKNMSLDWVHYHGKGEANLTGNLKFDDKDYTGKVKTKNNFDYLKFSVDNPIVKTDVANVTWNYGIAGFLWDVGVKGTAGGVNTSSSKQFGVPVPIVGVGASAKVANGLNVYANVSGLPLGGYGHIADVEAGLHYEPITNLGLNVGYRLIDIDVNHEDDSASYKLAGPFAGLSYKF